MRSNIAPGGKNKVEVGYLANDLAAHVPRPGSRTIGRPAAHLIIHDSGIGIATASLPQLFEQFYRADNAVGIPGY